MNPKLNFMKLGKGGVRDDAVDTLQLSLCFFPNGGPKAGMTGNESRLDFESPARKLDFLVVRNRALDGQQEACKKSDHHRCKAYRLRTAGPQSLVKSPLGLGIKLTPTIDDYCTLKVTRPLGCETSPLESLVTT